MPNLGTYPSSYIPFFPSNVLPLPGDDLSYDWMETISQFSQRYMKMATAIATIAYNGGSYTFDYSSLGCDVFPPFLKCYYYDTYYNSWCQFVGQHTTSALPTDKAFFSNIGLGSANLKYYGYIGTNTTFYMIAYL